MRLRGRVDSVTKTGTHTVVNTTADAKEKGGSGHLETFSFPGTLSIWVNEGDRSIAEVFRDGIIINLDPSIADDRNPR